MVELKIDPEFESIIEPLTETEFNQLRENILDDGEILSPIITWNDLIVDGHNRWKILQENPGLPYKTHALVFLERESVIEWICRNQLGRRNLTDEQKRDLIGRMQRARKHTESFKGNQYTAKSGEVQNEPHQKPKSTAAQIAEEMGVSESYVKRAEKFANGIDAIREVNPEAANKALKGESGKTQAEIANVAKMEPKEREEFVDSIINPPPKEAQKPEPKPKQTTKPEEDEPQQEQSEQENLTSTDKGEGDDMATNEIDVESKKPQMNPIEIRKAANDRDAKIYASISRITNPDSVTEYSLDDFIEEIKMNGESFLSVIRTMIAAHSTMLNENGAREKIENAIDDYIISIFKKFKEDVVHENIS